MVDTFSAAVNKWVAESDARMTAVMKQSVMDVIDEAQTPVAKGGRMRVDTGFLRASGQVSLNEMPTGPVRNETGEEEIPARDSITVLTIARSRLGDTIFFGWTANYARARENKDAFLRSAVAKWQEIVNKNARELRNRSRK